MSAAQQLEVFEALREMGITEEKAVKVATVLSRRDDDVADVKNDVKTIDMRVEGLTKDVAEVKKDIAEVKKDTADLKRDNAVVKWMLGFILAAVMTVVFKAFLH